MSANPKIQTSSDAAMASAIGSFVLSQRDFQHIVKTLFNDSGIHLPESKTAFVQARLSKRLHALGLRSFRDYCVLISQKEGVNERQKMIAALTTNITRFFRESHHFDHLREKMLPPLVETARKGGRVRLWSAGCSTGPEAYSIALTILSLLPEAAALDVRILASDIDPEVLAVGAAGLYTEKEIENVPQAMRQRWFESLPAKKEDDPAWKVSDALKRLIVFRELNLNGPWPMRGAFHVIFCRNVVIYFDERTQMRLWNRFLPLISPGGALYLGHSENLSGEATQAFLCEGMTTYRRREPGTVMQPSSLPQTAQAVSRSLYNMP